MLCLHSLCPLINKLVAIRHSSTWKYTVLHHVDREHMSAALRAYAERETVQESGGGSTSAAAVALDEDNGPLCGKRVTIGGLVRVVWYPLSSSARRSR